MATRLLIEGLVQGVGYRDWLRGEATRRGFTGWCRNLSDGRVEAVVVGAHGDVDRLVEACRVGPPSARVTGIGLDPVEDVTIDGFVVLPTL